MWFVCIILISYESSFLGHHDFEKEGVSSLSVAINFDEVFKYVIQGRSLPSSKYFLARMLPSRYTMAGFEDFPSKTQAWNLAPAGSILFQFQKSKNLAHDPHFFEPWKQESLKMK